MHLSDGFLNPTACVATGLAAGGVAAWAMRRARQTEGDRLVPLMGMMSACIFSAQMVNFPVLAGTSGHLLGGVLAAVVLGPWAGLLSMLVVLCVQCLLFYDGGFTVLGANVLNMAVVGSLGGYAIYSLVRRLVGGTAGIVAGAVVAAWAAVQLSAVACALELSLAGTYPLRLVLPALLLVHSVIGVGEALATGLVVVFLLGVRPELIYSPAHTEMQQNRWRRVALAGGAVAVLVAFCVSPLASAAPDGLEHVTESLGQDELPMAEAWMPTLMADYQVPGLDGIWLATSLAGVLGALITCTSAWLLARGLRTRPS